MMSPSRSLPLLPLALAFLLPAATADTITKTDGTVIEDVTVEGDTWREVTYQDGSDSKTVPADQVLSITFSGAPEDVDEARAALAEGDVAGAAQLLEGYVSGQLDRPTERRYPWAPAHATFRAMQLRLQLFDLLSAREAATVLIDNFGDSRYVPEAYLARAKAEAWSGEKSAARETLSALEEMVEAQGLSKRWALEVQLAQVRLDDGKAPASKRADYAQVASEAGSSYPTVAARARVAEGESYVQEAENTGDGLKAADLRRQAQAVFEAVADDPKADGDALAGAYTGLGDCLFFAGAAADDEALLQQAAKRYLRVIVNHPEEGEYVPKSLFYAMRCFQLLEDQGRRADMRSELLALYPETSWAQRPEVRN